MCTGPSAWWHDLEDCCAELRQTGGRFRTDDPLPVVAVTGLVIADLHPFIGVVAGLIGLVGFIPYGVSVLRGLTQPSIASWVIWTPLGSVLSASYFFAGSGTAWWLTGSYAVGPLLILLMSLRVGRFSWDKLDSLYIGGALVGLVWWWASGVAAIAQTVSIAVDICGTIPTLKKVWPRPESENAVAWWVFSIAGILNLFAIDRWSFESGLYPVYAVAVSAAVTFCVIRQPVFRQRS